jgi:hypothetical protein
MLVVLGALLLALALVVLASFSASKPADAATQLVTKRFDNPATILIPAGAHPGSDATCDTGPTEGVASPYPSIRSIRAFPAGSHIFDVNLVLRDYSHTYPADVDVLLSKGAISRTVMSDAIGGGAAAPEGTTLILDDEAANGPLPEDENDPIPGGKYQPTNYGHEDEFPGFPDATPTSNLHGFDGLNPNGIWKLRVVDDDSSDCGEFGDGWRLIIRAKVPTG